MEKEKSITQELIISLKIAGLCHKTINDRSGAFKGLFLKI